MKENPGGITMAALAAALDGNLKNTLIASTPGGIEEQEAQGQRDLVAAGGTSLPSDAPWGDLEKLGFQNFGPMGDEVFVDAKLPDGWTIAATDHSMWSDVKDTEGVVRAKMFYKAAFYDRCAHLQLV